MKTIVCYGDSNTWGFNPGFTSPEDMRFPHDIRWTGRLQALLGADYLVEEEGLCGRTTVFDDMQAPGRNGLRWLIPCLHTHQPVDLIIFMLGTNDVKSMFSAHVKDISGGMEALLKSAKNPYVYDRRVAPEILLISPVPVGSEVEGSWLGGTFDRHSAEKSKELATEYLKLSKIYSCHFLDAGEVCEAAPGEHIHLDEKSHAMLSEAVANKIWAIL